MKQIIFVLLLIAVCCSACSSLSSGVVQDAPKVPPSSSDQLSEANSAVSLLENDYNDDISSFSAQEKPSVESDTSATTDYQGFTHEQWNKIQHQKEQYGAMSEKEKNTLQFNGTIDCSKFIHLQWEHLITMDLVDYVGADKFNAWVNDEERAGRCVNIYSVAKYFSVDLDELISTLEKTNLYSEVYDIDTAKRRYAYFNGDLQE